MRKIFLLSFLVLIFFIGCKKINEFKSIKLLPYLNGDYYGYIDYNGKVIINPQFENAEIFNDGLALVKNTEGNFGFINEEGKYIIPAIYKDANSFSEGLALVKNENGGLEYIDKIGKPVIKLDSKFQYAGSFREELARVFINNKSGFIDKNGKIIIPATFDSTSPFLNGLAIYQENTITNGFSQKLDVKYGFIDKSGSKVIPAQFDEVFPYYNQSATVKIGANWGVIDNKGKFIINPQYKEIYGFFDGIAIVRQGDLFGYIDEKRNFIINPQFKNLSIFSNLDLAPAQSTTNEKWGFINKKGDFVISPQFDNAEPFFDEIAIVTFNNKMGIIDKTGRYVVNPIYTKIKSQPYKQFNSYNSSRLIKSDIESHSETADNSIGNSDDLYYQNNDSEYKVEDSASMENYSENKTFKYEDAKDIDNTTSEAEFPGGIKNLQSIIINHLDTSLIDIPESQKPSTIQCNISYTIKEDGSVVNIEANGVNEKFNKEAIRVFKNIKTRWIPAKQKGKLISKSYNFPITMSFSD